MARRGGGPAGQPASAQDKLAQLDAEARRSNAVSLGMPAFGQITLGTRETKKALAI
jgi:hypothetical protein